MTKRRIEDIGRIIIITSQFIRVKHDGFTVDCGVETLAKPFNHLKVGDYVRDVPVPESKRDKRGIVNSRLVRVRTVTSSMKRKLADSDLFVEMSRRFEKLHKLPGYSEL